MFSGGIERENCGMKLANQKLSKNDANFGLICWQKEKSLSFPEIF